MTVSTETNRWIFDGNGLTTSFSYTNRIFADTDLEVFLLGVLQTLITDYSVSGVDNPAGGNIDFVVAPPSGTDNVVAVRNVPAQQPTDYVEGDKFPAESHERGLDRGIIINQQNQAAILRTLRLADSDPDFSIDGIPDAATRKNARLGFDANSKPIAVTADVTGVAATAFGASLMDDVDAAAARTTLGSTTVGDALFIAVSATAARATLGVVIGTDVQADLAVPSQAEAEAGTATIERVWTAQRVKQAIAALAPTPIPSGTVMLFRQSTAPTGWTKDTATAAFNEAALRVMTTGAFVSSSGTTAFSTVFSQTVTGVHAGTTPSHTHVEQSSTAGTGAVQALNRASIGSGGGFRNDPFSSGDSTNETNIGALSTQSGGAGGTHSHTVTLNPKYIDVIIASKD